jgi:ABC-type arginine transport system permease subunit
MLPAFTGQAISLFKDTSVVVVLGVGELLAVARTALGSDVTHTPYWLSLYMPVAVLYLSVALLASNGIELEIVAAPHRRLRIGEEIIIHIPKDRIWLLTEQRR